MANGLKLQILAAVIIVLLPRLRPVKTRRVESHQVAHLQNLLQRLAQLAAVKIILKSNNKSNLKIVLKILILPGTHRRHQIGLGKAQTPSCSRPSTW